MSVFAALTREHRLMLDLVARVERAFGEGDDDAGRRGLLVLYHALALHEEVEDRAVGPADPRAPAALAAALKRVARQHAELERLREEARELCSRAGDRDSGRVRALTLQFAGRLRGHFDAEERVLWPLLAARGGSSLARRA